MSTFSDPRAFLVGCSGGVYALIFAHLANVMMNWNEMKHAWLRLSVLIVFTIADTANAIYYRSLQGRGKVKISFAAHIAGAIGGFLLGALVLRNLKLLKWEGLAWWALFYTTLAYFGVCAVVSLTGALMAVEF